MKIPWLQYLKYYNFAKPETSFFWLYTSEFLQCKVGLTLSQVLVVFNGPEVIKPKLHTNVEEHHPKISQTDGFSSATAKSKCVVKKSTIWNMVEKYSFGMEVVIKKMESSDLIWIFSFQPWCVDWNRPPLHPATYKMFQRSSPRDSIP